MTDELGVGALIARLADQPAWLRAALDADRVAGVLATRVAGLRPRSAKLRRLVLREDGHWEGTYELGVEDGRGGKRPVRLLGTLTPPGRDAAADPGEPSAPFGEPGWRVRLAELGLDLQTEPEETALDLLGELTDPELARKLLERAIGEATPERHGLRLDACTPEVLSYKPGRRAVIRYRLDGATRPVPATVVAKTYKRERTGQVAWDAMTALWRSPLGGGEVVTIAEPLAWIAEQRLLVQGPVPEELTLEDLLAAAFAEPDGAAMQRARHFVRMAAAGLAALHRSGVGLGETVTWREQHEQIVEMLDRIRAAVPDAGLDEAIGPLLRRFEQLGAGPGAATVPSHGSFAPEQVLIHGGRIALIDFDAYCQAEPAMDAGEFVAALPDLATKAGSGLDVADALAEEFLAAYERLAPLSRERVALWQELHFTVEALRTWTKPKSTGGAGDLAILEHYLSSALV